MGSAPSSQSPVVRGPKVAQPVTRPTGYAHTVAAVFGPGRIPEERLVCDILETLSLDQGWEVHIAVVAARCLHPSILFGSHNRVVRHGFSVVQGIVAHRKPQIHGNQPAVIGGMAVPHPI